MKIETFSTTSHTSTASSARHCHASATRGARHKHCSAINHARRQHTSATRGMMRGNCSAMPGAARQPCPGQHGDTSGQDVTTVSTGKCNLNMEREFLANWIPKERSNQVKIRDQIIEFAPIALNRLLGTPHDDPQPFIDIVKKPPYGDIRHTLCGTNSAARWTRHQ
ncbi:hypothetical protein HAX54_045776 [Datura stramonium]|uniref:Uncharacterized protein n=1 Tax=Datura stramonium TaxID=4076 RepID=A0ABS8WGA0_DATST|nr:hypothetical protein [Datura stramonium]